MARDTEDEDTETGVLRGTCEHCEWAVTANSHAELVTAYQDHLREEHPDVWLHT